MGSELSTFYSLDYIRYSSYSSKRPDFRYGLSIIGNFCQMDKIALCLLNDNDILYAQLFEDQYNDILRKILPFTSTLYYIGRIVDKNVPNLGFSIRKIIDVIKDNPREEYDIVKNKELVKEVGRVYPTHDIDSIYDSFINSNTLSNYKISEKIVFSKKNEDNENIENIIIILLGKLKVISILYHELNNVGVELNTIRYIINGIFKMYYIKRVEYSLLKIAYEMNLSDEASAVKIKCKLSDDINPEGCIDDYQLSRKYLSFFNPDVKYDKEKAKRSDHEKSRCIINDIEELSVVNSVFKIESFKKYRPGQQNTGNVLHAFCATKERIRNPYVLPEDIPFEDYCILNNPHLNTLFDIENFKTKSTKNVKDFICSFEYRNEFKSFYFTYYKKKIKEYIGFDIPYSTFLKDDQCYLYFDIEHDFTNKEILFNKFINIKNKIIKTFIFEISDSHELQRLTKNVTKNPISLDNYRFVLFSDNYKSAKNCKLEEKDGTLFSSQHYSAYIPCVSADMFKNSVININNYMQKHRKYKDINEDFRYLKKILNDTIYRKIYPDILSTLLERETLETQTKKYYVTQPMYEDEDNQQ